MSLNNVKDGKLLYHLTKLKNLDSIIKNGLLARCYVKDNNINFSDIADSEIISKRSIYGLDKYIPFHFHPYSSFDYAVKSNNKFDEFIYICIDRSLARENDFKIIPIHPISSEDKFKLCSYDEGFSMIDWNAMSISGNYDKYVKHVKMAECLSQYTIPIEFVKCIYVKNEEAKNLVENKLRENGILKKPPYVNIKSEWF